MKVKVMTMMRSNERSNYMELDEKIMMTMMNKEHMVIVQCKFQLFICTKNGKVEYINK